MSCGEPQDIFEQLTDYFPSVDEALTTAEDDHHWDGEVRRAARWLFPPRPVSFQRPLCDSSAVIDLD